MSTIPFVQVEGTLALPHIRPLARLPASFGKEWALTAPHFSLRTELRALYAAIMRTVCLSVEAFRAAARWDHLRIPVPMPPAPVAAPVAPEPARATATRAGHAQRTSAATGQATPPFERRKLTGGAVAIGSAALLAWIVASHTPSGTQTASSKADSHANASAGHDAAQRLADARAEHDHAVAGGTAPQAAATQPATAPAPKIASPIATAPAPKTASSTAIAPASTIALPITASERKAPPASAAVRAQRDFSVQPQAKTAAPARLVQREKLGNDRALKRAAGQRVAGRGTSLRHGAHEFAPYREASPVTTQRSRGSYSQAQVYSPRQSSANPVDEYASVLTYANTYATPRAANRPTVAADSTDWVNHVSQRRVTEVPDRFAK
ncbi:conserved hypothetical protein [Paraburkholderia unamae]|uniref:hypothetical protein n=1 Tax=Paraburkholderia unamae TaxID=219649 RepID=UPI001CB3800D|nr:hypothetical protein [Paraburkholderia unamae]CAG9274884.1 conserved hypothetical protein [Paraburkholderia unamae]